MHFERVCKQTSPIRGQAFAVPTCQWQGRARGGLRPPVLCHKLSLGSVKVSSIKKNSSARNEIDKVAEPEFVTDERQRDQALSSERLVVDTSDEDSNLPGMVVDAFVSLSLCWCAVRMFNMVNGLSIG
jgi:hypothetical protein